MEIKIKCPTQKKTRKSKSNTTGIKTRAKNKKTGKNQEINSTQRIQQGKNTNNAHHKKK